MVRKVKCKSVTVSAELGFPKWNGNPITMDSIWLLCHPADPGKDKEKAFNLRSFDIEIVGSSLYDEKVTR